MTDQADYERLAENLTARGIDVEKVKTKLKQQHIETPSWAYADSGTRFHVFHWPGAARTIEEKVSDAAYVNRVTGVAPSMAIHIPWDKTDDWGGVAEFAHAQGISLGAVNPNLFQDDAYRLGSITHPDGGVREQALGHLIECCEIMATTGSRDLSLWFADGTNYAGQDNMTTRRHRMQEALAQTYQHLPRGGRMLIEYKFFEPAFYLTDLPDWGTAYATALKLGEQAAVLVDTGHHAQGTNIPQIVAFLLDEGRLGGFHFNARKYADDDLIVGTANPAGHGRGPRRQRRVYARPEPQRRRQNRSPDRQHYQLPIRLCEGPDSQLRHAQQTPATGRRDGRASHPDRRLRDGRAPAAGPNACRNGAAS
jgi:L-rhamnose isomerase/sugar isomerase